MPRFFVEEEPFGDYFVGGENGVHIVKSLRMQPGERMTLCAGTGKDFFCTVLSCGPAGALVRVDREQESVSEPRVKVTVCSCWPKADKLETVTQKAVELGTVEIWPLESSRCVVKLDGKTAERKTVRLQKIALEAAQQSGRGIVPKVLPLTNLKKALEQAASMGDVLFFYEKGTVSLKETLGAAGDRLFLFVGPEGGFTPEEASFAEGLGAKLLTLGPRILRAETAPLAALSAVMYEKGEMER